MYPIKENKPKVVILNSHIPLTEFQNLKALDFLVSLGGIEYKSFIGSYFCFIVKF